MAVKHKFIAVVLLACIASAAFIGWQRSILRNSMVRFLSSQTAILAENCKAALAFHDAEDAKETLSTLHVEPSIVFGGVYTRDNKLFAAYYRDYVSTEVHPNELQNSGFSFNGGLLSVFKPIVLDGEIIGTVCLRLDMSPMYATLRRNIGIIIAVLFLFALVFSSVVGTSSSG